VESGVKIRVLRAGLIQFLTLSLLLGAFYLVPMGASPEVIWPCLLVFYVCFGMALARPVSIYREIPSFIKIDVLFLVFYYILFFLPYQLYVLDEAVLWYSPYLRRTFVPYTNISIVASTIGLVAFLAGYRTKSAVAAKVPEVRRKPETTEYALLLVISLLFAFFLAIYFVRGGFSEMSMGAYAGSETKDPTSDGIYFLVTHFAMLAGAAAVYFVRRASVFSLPVLIVALLVSIWGGALLVMGDRNNFFLVCVVLLAGVATYFWRIARWQILALMMLALVTYQAVEVGRRSERRSLSEVVTAFGDVSSLRTSYDESSFSNTTATSRAAFYLVPGQYDYFWGKFKLIGVAGVVPYSRGLIVERNDPLVTSADVLTVGLVGNNATWSVGSNVVSDIYMDFGIYGVIVLMWLMGLWGAWVESRAASRPDSMMWSSVYLLCVGLYAEIPRYSFDFPVRNLAWTFLLFAGFYAFVRSVKRGSAHADALQ